MRKQARWLAVVRVNTRKPVTSSAVFETLRGVWGLAHDPELREVDDNLFTFKFFCLGDWNKVMHQGPWLFKKLVVVIAEYDGLGNPKEVKLDRTNVWAQIHSIPEIYRVNKVVDDLARRIGKVQSVVMNPVRYFEGNYVRVRANIDVGDPLIRFAPLNVAGKRELLHIKYEKIGYFCDVCGIMGHDLEECGDGVHDQKSIQYGKWMIAKRRVQASQSFFRGGMAGWRGGRGRGRETDFFPRKRSSVDMEEEEEDISDTASSPMKEVGNAMAVDGKSKEIGAPPKAAKQLTYEKEGEINNDGGGLTANDVVNNSVPPLPPAYIPTRSTKRPKKVGEDGKAISNDSTSAASFEGDRREQ